MYDEVHVDFADGTDTIIFVPCDDDLQEVLAELADAMGLEVEDFQIVDTFSTEDTGFEDEDEDEPWTCS